MPDEDVLVAESYQLMDPSNNEHVGDEMEKGDLDLTLMTQPEYSDGEISNSKQCGPDDVADQFRQPAKSEHHSLSTPYVTTLSQSTHEVVSAATHSSPVIHSVVDPSSQPSASLHTEHNIDGSVQSNDIACKTQSYNIQRSDENGDGQRNQRFLRKMEMKQKAIYRSLLHLCDNSHSFVYDESNTPAMNDDDEPGLPFIGPDLKEQYEVLRALLRKGLLGSTQEDGEDALHVNYRQSAASNPFLPQIKSNVSAILMGPRGHGKSLVLDRCLASLSRLARKRKDRILDLMMQGQQAKQADEMYAQASFRVVRLNGLLFQGDSAVACTQEIARQLSVMSREERRRSRRIIRQMSAKRNRSEFQEDKTPKSSRDKRKKDKSAASSAKASAQAHSATKNDESHDLRVRRSGFNTYIALLDEVLRTAQVDGIPILIVLEELDTFLAAGGSSNAHNVNEISESGNPQQEGGGSDRQLLLYHLLDRVADHKFLVSFVGMTTDLTAITRLEKRVQSRAEGTSKLIYFGHNKDYEDLVKCLVGKFYTPPGTCESDTDEYNEQNAMLEIRGEVETILRGRGFGDNLVNSDDGGDDDEINDFALVQRVFQRNYNLKGSDVRWVCRVFEVALGLLASDIDERIHHSLDSNSDGPSTTEENEFVPKLTPSHVAQALVTMSASLDDMSGGVGLPGIPTRSALELIRWGQLIGDPKHYSCLVGTHSRLVALLGLSGPQVAVLLAARRIDAREGSACDGTNQSESLPLTYQRIQDEYATSFVASNRYTISSDRYPLHVMYRSCTDLMELGAICLKKQICGGGALQYGHNEVLCSGADISNLPLHMNVEWELEFVCLLKAGLLQCSTALREWGMKVS